MPAFARYIGIDYSGAETPSASLKGLRIYMADRSSPPLELMPPPSPRKYWTRRGVAEWLVERLAEDAPSLVGIDHGFSFPLRYFESHALKPEWSTFLDDFQHHWPTDENIYVDFVRDGIVGNGAARSRCPGDLSHRHSAAPFTAKGNERPHYSAGPLLRRKDAVLRNRRDLPRLCCPTVLRCRSPP